MASTPSDSSDQRSLLANTWLAPLFVLISLLAYRCVRLQEACRPYTPKKRGRPRKVHRVQSETGGVSVSRPSGSVSTLGFSAPSGDDGRRGRTLGSSGIISPAYSPIIWNLRSLRTFVYYTNANFHRMVDAGEVLLPRAAALM